jgi:hypothetical protein
VWQHCGLGHETFDHQVRQLRAEHIEVALSAHGDEESNRLVAEGSMMRRSGLSWGISVPRVTYTRERRGLLAREGGQCFACRLPSCHRPFPFIRDSPRRGDQVPDRAFFRRPDDEGKLAGVAGGPELARDPLERPIALVGQVIVRPRGPCRSGGVEDLVSASTVFVLMGKEGLRVSHFVRASTGRAPFSVCSRVSGISRHARQLQGRLGRGLLPE